MTRQVFVRKPALAQVGFTLLEVAMVLLILSALMASVMQPLGARFYERQRYQTQQRLYEVRDALIGFAAANHRLPCPAQSNSALEGDCSASSGFVPSATLGVAGPADDNGLLLDSWNQPLRYSVTLADANADGLADFLTSHQIRDVGMADLKPDLQICQQASGCGGMRANQVTAVVFSTGRNGATTASTDELENLDADRRFVSRDLDQAGEQQFDDQVIWLSENVLYSKLIQAGVLP